MTTILRLSGLFAGALVLASCGSPPHPPANADLNWHPPSIMLQNYDANRDGTVSRAEMDAGLRKDFDTADKNHDGCLDSDEASAVNQARWLEDASTASPLMDWNHDGCINLNEFGLTQRSLFDQLDTNNDGQLTPHELAPEGIRPPPPEPVAPTVHQGG